MVINSKQKQALIDKFFQAISNLSKNIDNNKKLFGFFSYNAYFSLYDVITKYAFPEERYLINRYRKLIRKYSDWLYKDYISITQLNCLINSGDGKLKNSILREPFQQKINQKGLFAIQYGIIDSPEKYDLTLDELKVGLDTDQMEEFERKRNLIIKARYDSLFYYMRCLCVHGLQFPTPNALNSKQDGYTPMYFVMSEINDTNGKISNPKYILWFPPNLISNLFKECVKNLYKDSVVNPEDIFKPYYVCWIDQFK
ncbi:MAG: hypothetical protein ACOWWH_14140 [Eubacteriaceae bacterium]